MREQSCAVGPSLGVRSCFVHRVSPRFTVFHRVFFGPDPAAVASWLRSAGCGFAFKERFGEVRDMHFRAFFCTFRLLKPGELVSRFSPVFPGRPRFSLGAGPGAVRKGLVEAGCDSANRRFLSRLGRFFLGILHVFFVFLRKMRDGLVTVW